MSLGDPIQAWLPVLPLAVNRPGEALAEIRGQR
jgi:hypothetical protein